MEKENLSFRFAREEDAGLVLEFIRQLAGICYNPHRRGSEADIRPHFVEALRFADGWHMAPEGKIAVHWERDGAGV